MCFAFNIILIIFIIIIYDLARTTKDGHGPSIRLDGRRKLASRSGLSSGGSRALGEAAYLRGSRARSGLSSGGSRASQPEAAYVIFGSRARSGLSSGHTGKFTPFFRFTTHQQHEEPPAQRLAQGHRQAWQEVPRPASSTPRRPPRRDTRAGRAARHIGSHENRDDAVKALAAAQAKFDEGGETAVWAGPKAVRAQRNMVRVYCNYSNGMPGLVLADQLFFPFYVG
jgi:hypothetical protein